jgi:hypothetical protein
MYFQVFFLLASSAKQVPQVQVRIKGMEMYQREELCFWLKMAEICLSIKILD